MTEAKRKFSPGFVRAFLICNAVAAFLVLAAFWAKQTQRTHLIEAAAMRAGQIHDVDPRLILAVMKKESRFDPNAVGKAGEIGLMQIMPATAMEWAHLEKVTGFQPDPHLFDPEINAEVGAWYIGAGLNLWNTRVDPVPYALARYNAGQSRVVKWAAKRGDFIDNIEFDGTRQYVRDVLKTYRGDDKERTHE